MVKANSRVGRCCTILLSFIVLLAVSGTRVVAADIEPLASADLEARLTIIGFDAAQRAQVLAAFEQYVQQYTSSAAPRVAQWQSICTSIPATLEDARSATAAGRALVQAIDEGEQPLMDAIQRTARAEQSEAASYLIAQLALRRDLSIARSVRQFGTAGGSDLLQVMEGLKLPAATVDATQPQMKLYLMERVALVHKLRDAAVSLPQRMFDADQQRRAAGPPPTPPSWQVTPAVQDGDSAPAAPAAVQAQEGDSHVVISEYKGPPRPEDLQRMRERDEYFHALAEYEMGTSSRARARAELTAVNAKLTELDVRTIDAILPALGGVQRARLLAKWWSARGLRLDDAGSNPGRLRQAWSSAATNATPEVQAKLDAICAQWSSAWWPIAKDWALENPSSVVQTFQFVGQTEADSTTPQAKSRSEVAANATQQAADEIQVALGGEPSPASEGQGGSGRIAGAHFGTAVPEGAEGTAQFVVKGVQLTGTGGPPQEITGDVQMIAVGPDGVIDLIGAGMDGGPITIDLGGIAELADLPELVQGIGDGTAAGFPTVHVLPKMVKFEEIEPVLVAAGVTTDMRGVARTALEDLVIEASAIREAGEEVQREFDGETKMVGQDGKMIDLSPEALSRRAANRAQVRAQLLALESSFLADTLAALVPPAGVPTVAWLVPWRALESDRAAVATMGLEFRGTRFNDPIAAVMAAGLSSEDWKAAAGQLPGVCQSLSGSLRAYLEAGDRASKASPMFFGTEQGTVQVEDDSGEKYQRYIKAQSDAAAARDDVMETANLCINQIKSTLKAEAAGRLQDAWDDQRFASALRDRTALASRFEAALSFSPAEATTGKVKALQQAWTLESLKVRAKIIANRSVKVPTPTMGTVDEAGRAKRKELKAELAALTFERDELNRKYFRELCLALGDDLAKRLVPLPEPKKARTGATILTTPAGK